MLFVLYIKNKYIEKHQLHGYFKSKSEFTIIAFSKQITTDKSKYRKKNNIVPKN